MASAAPIDGNDEGPAVRMTARALARARSAQEAGALDEALRWADRARRLTPDQPLIDEVAGRLARKTERPRKALELLRSADDGRPSPELSAEIVETHLDLGDAEGARSALDRALSRFALDPGGALEAAAGRLVREHPAACPGWIGVAADLSLRGEACILQEEGRHPLERPGAPRAPSRPPDPFQLGAPQGHRGPLGALLGRRDLAGGAQGFPPDFRVAGRCVWKEGVLSGWASLEWAPSMRPEVFLGEEGMDLVRLETLPGDDPGRWTFSAPLPQAFGSKVRVFARTPDGGLADLPTSPVLLRLPAPPKGLGVGPPEIRNGQAEAEPVDVVIPIYAGLEETLACLASVERHDEGVARIIVVDDASPDDALRRALTRFADAGRITLLRNKTNLGFPGAVNAGLALAGARDVVVLNADAEVFAGWLPRLRAAAHRDADVGTVTPLSNAGSLASYPAKGSSCSREEAAEIAAAAAAVNAGVVVDAPTGVGFCLYIRGDCLLDVGVLDEITFARGYGEENDFCLRAAALGWRSVIAADVYVRHLEGRSFGPDRGALRDRNLDLLLRRHPGFLDAVEAFGAADPLQPFRRRIDEALAQACVGRVVLLVAHRLGGGVGKFLEARRREIRAAGLIPVTVRPEAEGGLVKVDFGEERLASLLYASSEVPALGALLKALSPAWMELHHYHELSEPALEALFGLGVPYDVFLHDYALACPRYTMMGGEGRFCGGPPLEACEACVQMNGSFVETLSVRQLRERSAEWLAGARSVYTPSKDLRRRVSRFFPEASLLLRPLEPEKNQTSLRRGERKKRAGGSLVTVGVIGALTEGKGFSLLRRCAEDAAARELPIRFVVVGWTRDDEGLHDLGNAFVTGPYEGDEVFDLLDREAVDLAFFPNIAPESWSYALSEALAAGLPVLALDIGPVPERLAEASLAFRVLPLDTEAPAINDGMLKFFAALDAAEGTPASGSPGENTSKILRRAAGSSSGLARTGSSHQPVTLERQTERESQAMVTSAATPRATVQLLLLPVGLYRFSVLTDAAIPGSQGDDLPLPAVQISAGPGAGPDAIDYLGVSAKDGAWLFSANDTLVVRIKAMKTAIFVTSYTREGSEPLEIEIEKVGSGRRAKKGAEAPLLEAPARPVLGNGAGPGAVVGSSRRRSPEGALLVPVRVDAHIQRKGDVVFMDQPVIGFPDQRLPIEGFSLEPLGEVSSKDIEYKTLSEKGVESAWTRGGGFSGTKQMALALSGFCVRLKGEKASTHHCRYHGVFQSGARVGPRQDGAPVMSSSLSDYLVGIELEIFERTAALSDRSSPAMSLPPAKTPEPALPAEGGRSSRRVIGPRFGVFREDV